MSKHQTNAACPEAIQQPPVLQPCLYNLGAHALEVLEDETAIIVKTEEINEMVSLSKEELYYLLQVLHELFQLGSVGA